jgi:hypothetical protein
MRNASERFVNDSLLRESRALLRCAPVHEADANESRDLSLRTLSYAPASERYLRGGHSSSSGWGIESWARLSASRSRWFFSQTSRWRTRRIIGTTITAITTIPIRGLIDCTGNPGIDCTRNPGRRA